MLFWIFIGAGIVLLILRLWVGPPEKTGGKAAPRHPPTGDGVARGEPELWTVEAVQRYGTPDTAADLASEGRAGELRGLGYEGDGQAGPPDR